MTAEEINIKLKEIQNELNDTVCKIYNYRPPARTRERLRRFNQPITEVRIKIKKWIEAGGK